MDADVLARATCRFYLAGSFEASPFEVRLVLFIREIEGGRAPHGEAKEAVTGEEDGVESRWS